MERWQMRDPFEVYARKQAQERRQASQGKGARQDRARQGLEELFKEVPGGNDSKQPDRR